MKGTEKLGVSQMGTPAEVFASGAERSVVAKPSLLFLCQTLPYPPDGGVEIRTFNLLRVLARSFDVTVLCFYRKASRGSPEQVARCVTGLSRTAPAAAFPIPQEHSRIRCLWDHLRSVVEQRVYTRYAYDSKQFRSELRKLLTQRHFDLVHLDSLDLSAYVDDFGHLQVACTHHNVESELLRRRASSERFHPYRLYLNLQAKLMQQEERSLCRRFALNVAVSDGDRRRLEAISPGARFEVVPNGVDTAALQMTNSDDRSVVFVGGYSWYPNRDGMEFFCSEILPLIRQEVNIPVKWVGRAPPEVIAAYAERYRVEMTGYVHDISQHVDGPSCFVVPLRVGGGSRLKILDAWAMGKPVVSTSIGCEGLDAREGENILIRDRPHAFAAAVLELLHNDKLRSHLALNARKTAVEQYDWELLGSKLTSLYVHLLGETPTAERIT